LPARPCSAAERDACEGRAIAAEQALSSARERAGAEVGRCRLNPAEASVERAWFQRLLKLE
jgi:hypothetical protein